MRPPDVDRDTRIDDIEFMRSTGEHERNIARRLGMTWENYSQFVRRYTRLIRVPRASSE